MKLKFTRKTWYFLLLASAAASMLNGFAVLSGTSFSLIEQIAFAAAGIAALFLAAEKGSASWEKRNFTGVFVLLMVSYMVNGWAGYLCSALAWPLLLSTEYKRGMAIQRQLQLVGAAEALHLFFLLMTKYGGMAALGFWTNLLWVLLACARGWAALSLYKMQEDA
uniref:conjugal transfer protein TraD n=1 Tax=Faecalibacterium prausnitzii TaxID=853 RepID=UPI003FEED14D